MYTIIDTFTKEPASRRTYGTLRAASKAAERMNQKYGAHRYYYRHI
jgi:hypothetical protein